MLMIIKLLSPSGDSFIGAAATKPVLNVVGPILTTLVITSKCAWCDPPDLEKTLVH